MVCLQETKVAVFSVNMINELLGPDFDYSYLPSVGVSEGVLVRWRRDKWHTSQVAFGVFSVTLRLAMVD